MPKDSMQLDGAHELKGNLERFWWRQGYDPRIRVEAFETPDHRASWVVRSDMVNGRPTRRIKSVQHGAGT